jgi:ubiquinone/menaquinone biosynthesis C-methylase UbiE
MKRLHSENINTPGYFDGMWNDAHVDDFEDQVRQRALTKYVKDGDIVLDVGCGVYGSCQYLAERTKIKAGLICIDFSRRAMEIVTQRCKQITFIEGDIRDLPFPDRSIDCVIAGEIIEHMEDQAAFAKELCRVSRGWVALSTVNTESENAKKLKYPEHLWEFTPEDLTRLYAPFGEVYYELLGDYHMIYVKITKKTE